MGIDSLEYNFVRKWNLNNLKQKEYGRVTVPISDLGVPSSVQVWGSFLIGENYKETKFTTTSLLKKTYRILKLSKIVPKRLRRNINKKIIDQRGFPKLNRKTFVDECNFEHYNVAFIDLIEPEVLKKANELKMEEISINEFRMFLEEMYEKDKNNFLQHKQRNFFGYTNFFDIIQHYFYMDKKYIERMYKDLDKFLRKFTNTIENDDILLIISDHGTDGNGRHSTHGFYSLNKKLKLDNPDITNFYNLIMRKMNLPTKEDMYEINKRLRHLGYID